MIVPLQIPGANDAAACAEQETLASGGDERPAIAGDAADICKVVFNKDLPEPASTTSMQLPRGEVTENVADPGSAAIEPT